MVFNLKELAKYNINLFLLHLNLSAHSWMYPNNLSC